MQNTPTPEHWDLGYNIPRFLKAFGIENSELLNYGNFEKCKHNLADDLPTKSQYNKLTKAQKQDLQSVFVGRYIYWEGKAPNFTMGDNTNCSPLYIYIPKEGEDNDLRIKLAYLVNNSWQTIAINQIYSGWVNKYSESTETYAKLWAEFTKQQ